MDTRYNELASPIDPDSLAGPQIEALSRMERQATHLKGDRTSPDLFAVLKDIQRERGIRTRRERTRALLNTFDREWDRLYATQLRAEAVWSYNTWHRAGTIPTSWLANAMSERWLTNQKGKKRAPLSLAVRTPATEAIFGDDRDLFADGLDAKDATSKVVRELGFKIDPQVSEMIDQLRALRDNHDATDERPALLYAAIAAYVNKRDPAPDDMIGDLSMRRIRARFGTRPNNGLIHVSHKWLAPSQVFLGKPIFLSRRSFVSEHSAAELLWRALGMTSPSVGDCVDVLLEIAKGAPSHDDQKILVNTYLYLDEQLNNPSKQDVARLRSLPLWDGRTWLRARPIYLVADGEVAHALSKDIPIWKLPVAQAAVGRLIDAACITALKQESFNPIYHTSAFVQGAGLERQFIAAVHLLSDWLTRHDPKLFEANSISWDELEAARIAVDPHLQIELAIEGKTPILVPARAHITRNPLTFYFADAEAAGQDEAGGRALASLFTEGDRDKLALAWNRSWDRAGKGERGEVSLVEDRGEAEALSSLFQQAKGVRGTVPLAKRGHPQSVVTLPGIVRTPEQQLPVRHLKTIEDLSAKVTEVIGGNDAGLADRSPRRGLQEQASLGRRIGEAKSAPLTAPLAYSEQEREDLAVRVLQIAINGDLEELRDYRHLRGIGADAVDRLRRYFEIKATYGPMPDEITLTASEAERAFRETNKFFLAVVAGLEQGYETVVKIIPNPLRTLQFKPNTSLTLAGIRRVKALEVRFP
jgi:hypothetical protein